MAQLVPNIQLGRQVSACVLTPQSVSADGTLTDATGGGSVLATVTDIRKHSANNLEEVSPMSQRLQNYAIVDSASAYTFEGILLANDTYSTPTNLARVLAYGADYIKLVFSRTSGLVETFYGVISSYDEQWRKGAVRFSLTIAMVNPNTTNPTYSAS